MARSLEELIAVAKQAVRLDGLLDRADPDRACAASDCWASFEECSPRVQLEILTRLAVLDAGDPVTTSRWGWQFDTLLEALLHG